MKSAFAFIAAALVMTVTAHAHDTAQPFAEWMSTLKQPDTLASCCGPSDAHFVDNYQPSQTGGGFTVWLDGAEIEVPAAKVIWDRVNPTGRGVLFLSVGTDGDGRRKVYCFLAGTGT